VPNPNTKPVPDWRWGQWWGASSFVKKASSIREELLLKAVEAAREATPMKNRIWDRGTPVYSGVPGVRLHCLGGRAYDRHARRLVRDGLVTVQRIASHRAYSQRDGNIIRWSYLAPTEKGFAEADRILAKRK
jgi:hypothetical protein